MSSVSITFPFNSANHTAPAPSTGGRMPVITRFGDMVDVRNRGALRLARLVGIQVPTTEAPAVVRLWADEKCRELSIGQARALAEQLLEAARCAELQNM